MGKRGPKPKPTALLKLHGSWRADLNKHEPQPPSGDPECPDWLEQEAKNNWAELCPLLSAMRVLTKADKNALARYCQYLARWRQCEEWVTRFGGRMPVKKDGEVIGYVESPEVRQSLKYAAALSKLEADFGLTPSARTRIVAMEGEQKHGGLRERLLASRNNSAGA